MMITSQPHLECEWLSHDNNGHVVITIGKTMLASSSTPCEKSYVYVSFQCLFSSKEIT